MLQKLKGNYALVTGASEGLGREFASQLAALGINLVIVARNEPALNAVGEQLRNEFGVEVIALRADLARADELARLKTSLEARGVRISLLVNNAGRGGWGDFATRPVSEVAEIIDLNAKAPVSLAQIFFEHLRSGPGSAVINVASVAALQPIPYMAVYAASKSFLAHFGVALWQEWKAYGIHVQTLMPGAIATAFDEKSGGFVAPFPKTPAAEVVKLSLAHLNSTRRPLIYVAGSWSQRFFARVLPTAVLVKEVAKVFRPNDRSTPKS